MRVGEVRELTAAERDRLGRAAPPDRARSRPRRGLVVSLDGPARAARARSALAPPASSATASATPVCSIGRSPGWPSTGASTSTTQPASWRSCRRSSWRPTPSGRLTRVHVAGRDVTERVRDGAGRSARQHGRAAARGPRGAAAASARDRRSRPDHHGRPRHRHGRAARTPTSTSGSRSRVEERARRRAAERGSVASTALRGRRSWPTSGDATRSTRPGRPRRCVCPRTPRSSAATAGPSRRRCSRWSPSSARPRHGSAPADPTKGTRLDR